MPDGSAAAVGHNSLVEIGEQDFLAIVAQLGDVEAELKVLKDRRKKLRKEARGRGVRMTALDQALRMAEMERGEPQAHLVNLVTYMRWLRAPLGHQFTLSFTGGEDDSADGVDDDAAVEREAIKDAEFAGFTAGLNDKPQKENPYTANSPAGQAWLKFWHDGQKARKHKMAPFTTDAGED